jgi:hypothetical protein
MPRVTQYVRNEDLDKWNSIVNKSEFIHNALNSLNDNTIVQVANLMDKATPPDHIYPTKRPEPINQMALACCLLKNPCKHWQYNESKAEWVNTRTGEVKTVE